MDENSSDHLNSTATDREPIAVVGIGCRLPGGGVDAPSFWQMVLDGTDAIGDVPAERWNHSIFYHPEPGRPRSTVARQAGFIEDIDLFDYGFFGISPREASQMDPQHRLLLEVSWEALEDSGIVLDTLSGSPTAVFMGISAHEYALLQTTETINTHSSTGQATCMAANRVSYAFNLIGPSVSVDTACSSSLVAIHMACTSIWNGESSLALAGGVNVIVNPDTFVGFSNLSMLSADSRCFAFDARANGFVRSEGAGVIVLKALSQARVDGDRIHAVILGTAVNQDGHTTGVTVPSQASQEKMLKEAYTRARVAPHRVAFVEAHGTGTQVGDQIETTAIGNVLGRARPDGEQLLIGSVKTNVGHLEAAAGIAGVIKACLTLKHRLVPANLHFEQPNPRIDFDDLNLRVPVTATPLAGEAPLVAGVNSFGFGGTNAHVVLAEPPPVSGPRPPTPSRHPFLLPLSARSQEALAELAASFHGFLGEGSGSNSPNLGDVCHTAGVRRTHHPFRLVATGGTAEELRGVLEAYTAGQQPRGLVSGRVPPTGQSPPLAFLFTGQGSQWWGMGRDLLESEPVFRAVIERCDESLLKLAGWSLLAALAADEESSRMTETAFVQPMLFSMQAGLVELWRSRGVVPGAVVGHSVGEIAAAYTAGIMDLEEALTVAFHRGRLMDRASARGRMLAVGATPEDVAPYLAGFEDRVSLAAINSPVSLTLSGDPQALDEIRRALRRGRVGSTYVSVNYAFHSPQMDPVRGELLDALRDLSPRHAALRIISTVTGEACAGGEWDAGYWWKNLRQTVRFAPAVDALIEDGFGVFLEIGPQPTLAGSVKDCLRHRGVEAAVLSPLRKGRGDREALLSALAELHTLGVDVAWETVHPAGEIVALPRYAWQRERCWSEDERRRREHFVEPEHPLLGVEQLSAGPTWMGRLDLRYLPYLADHSLEGVSVFPATGYLETALAVGRCVRDTDVLELEDVTFESGCFLSEDGETLLETRYFPEESRFEICSRGTPDAAWTHHTSGRILDTAGVRPPAGETPKAIAGRLTETVPASTIYERFASVGLDYGDAFRGIRAVWRTDREALGEVTLPAGLDPEAGEYLAHPALLDSCFQVILAALPLASRSGRPRGAFLPVSLDRLRLYRRPGSEVYSHVTLRDFTEDALVADLRILDERGAVLLDAQGLRCQAIAAPSGTASAVDELLFRSQWLPQPRAEAVVGRSTSGTWLILADRGGLGARLEERLEREGHTVVVARPAHDASRNGHGGHAVDLRQPDSMKRLLAAVHGPGMPPLVRVVHLWGLDSEDHSRVTPGSLERDELRGTASLLHLIQALEGGDASVFPRLWVVTRRAQPFGDEERATLSVTQAPLWGLRRVAAFEHAHLRPSIVDIGNPESDTEIDSLLDELSADLPEDEVVLRGSDRVVHRYVRTSLHECAPPDRRAIAPGSHAFRATSARLGVLDNLQFTACSRPSLEPGEVRIAVESAGLNFADVLKALGLYPGVTVGSVTFGAECAGVVEAVGAPAPGTEAPIRPLEVGERVVALAPHCFGSSVTTPAPYVFPIPAGLTFDQAAAIPIVFLTAQYALTHLGRLRRGERVLIHAASGGVGLAAIQIARAAGAEILATAGSPEKREHLRSLGIRWVMDSRTLDFADEVMAATSGDGVDLVLNSLAGEAIAKGISVLRPFGRFIEIGKRDIHANSRLGLRPLRDNITFAVVDLDQAIRLNTSLVHDLFGEVMTGFADGALTPLPVNPFPITDIVGAFRYMSTAQHVGKITINNDVPAVEVAFPHHKPPVTADGTYLVTGGVGGFGRTVARWLVDHGARHVVLASRSGPDSPHAQQAIEDLGAGGCQVVVVAADVADPGQVRDLLNRVRETMPPLRGVVHAAMVLDDGIINRLDRRRLSAVTRPKVLGAWNLHQQTLDQPLDFFLMTSSISSIIGSPGQANYAAANAFLDSLAHYRRGLGLPALTLNLGAFDSVGHISRHPELASYLANMGIPPMPPADVLTALERLLAGSVAQVGVTRFDFPRLAAGPTGRIMPPRFADLLAAHGKPRRNGEKHVLLESLHAAAPQDREDMVLEALIQEMGRVLGTSTDDFDTDQPLSDLGVDSLMTVELLVWIEQSLGLQLPTVELMSNPTTAELAHLLVALLDSPDTGSAPASGAEAVDLRAEARLDPAIVPHGKPDRSGDHADVLLTGATGFVGAHLLGEILHQTRARVHCLVRAEDSEDAAERVRTAMESYGIWEESHAERIAPVPGNLSEPRFGRTAESFAELADTVAAIYHCGAVVNFLSPYAALRAPNVLGTQEVLRLACTGPPKMLNHISSTAVFSPKHYGGSILEDTVPHEVDGLPDGYSQSKWVAEQLVVAAMRQGLPARIYRPGILAGHSMTGVTSLNDALLQVFIACCRIGFVPDLDIRVDVTPVDTAARAVVHIATGDSPARVFHLCDPEPIPVQEIVPWLDALGIHIDVLPFQQWRDAMHSRAAEFKFEQLLPLVPESEALTLERLGGGERRFSIGNTQRALEGSAIPLERVDHEWFASYLRYLDAKGLLPAFEDCYAAADRP